MNRIIIAAVCALAARGGAWVQTAAQPLRFEVASIKPNPSVHDGINNKFGPDSMRWTAVPVTALLMETYGIKHYQIVGGPAWLASDRWDIDAESDGPTSRARKFEMLGTLLADRFKLRFHRETRQLPVYRLVVAKGGPKLAAAKEGERGSTRADTGLLIMQVASMPEFVWWLSSQLERPITDNTGLTGKYDLKLEWAQDDSQPAPAGDAPLAAADLPIFGAVQYQLGLKLEASKGPVEVLVIDHVERASGN